MKYFLLIGILIFHLSCNEAKEQKEVVALHTSFINTDHLDYLYTPVTFPNGRKAAGIYIYAEAPDYRHVADEDEGFTCVDDVARAVQVYVRSTTFNGDTALQNKSINLIHFILEMQSPNGYFYNFLFPDGRINTTGKTSVNDANWWSWRALHTLTEASPLIRKINMPLADRMDSSINKLITNIKFDLVRLPLRSSKVAGIEVPQYFPAGSASDQAAIILLALINYSSMHEDESLRNYIRTLSDGILQMQHGDEKNFPYACFLSWENVWHAYGNDQAYALLKAGKFLNDSTYINSALKEVNYFLPWLLKKGMLSSFAVNKRNTNYTILEEMQFAQIAYAIRPMIFATLEAFDITREEKYAALAKQLAAWFFGRNIAGQIMYDKQTGRGYDGILSTNKINKNSGAESTIEALLALQKMESYHLLDSTVSNGKE